MGEQDEAHARAVLTAMQARLAEGPFAALGVASTATPAEARAAFLQLTKTYHPARFGYMSAELQRLANEVFLSLRAAFDAIARPARAWGSRTDRSGTYRSDRSGVFPAVAKDDRSGVFPAGALRSERSGAFPAVIPPEKSDRTALPALVHAPTPSRAFPAVPAATGSRPPTAPRLPALSAENRATPPQGLRAAPKPAVAPASRLPPGRPTSTAPELAAALEQMQRGQWDAACAILTSLVERAPEVPRYRALICYARGREAQLAQRLEDARVELSAALQIDPDLQLAKTAMAELFTRRK